MYNEVNESRPLTAAEAILFNELTLQHYAKVLRFVKMLTNNASNSEDITQETFMKAYKAFPKFQNRSTFTSWIFEIAKNSFHDTRKSAMSRAEYVSIDAPIGEDNLSFQISDSMQNPENCLFVGGHFIPDLEKAIASLSPVRRKALLYKEEGFSYLEMAAAEGVAESAIKSRVFDARQELQKRLLARKTIIPNSTVCPP